MARISDLDTVVLVRPHTTTTYHFGLVTPICERTPTEGEAEPEPLQLAKAVAGRKEEAKRLCMECADLVAEWGRAGLVVAGEPGLEHPPR